MWHIQRFGSGPQILFLHGAGGSTHSFRALMSLCATQFDVIAIDLPGQGFSQTQALASTSLDGMTEDIGTLLHQENIAPDIIIAHSAGAAIAISLMLENACAPRFLLMINAALAEFGGLASHVFPMMAKALALNPLFPLLATKFGDPYDRATRILATTGSKLGHEDIGYYARLLADRDHVTGALNMMARWQLRPLIARLPEFVTPVAFLAGEGDRTVPARVSQHAAQRIKHAHYVPYPTYGHLIHEEAPQLVHDALLRFAQTHDVGTANR